MIGRMKRMFFFLLFVPPLLAGCAAGQREEPVRSVILMIGDGMGVAHITALSLEQDFEPLNMERATHIGLQKTYSLNNRVTDSAASGTALATGSKTNNGYVSITPDRAPLTSALAMAQENGMSTGLIVTCPPTAATPSVFYAHTPKRRNHEQIALQLLESGVDIIAGSGRPYFNERSDGRDLTAEFQAKGYTYAPDREALLDASSLPVVMLTDDVKNMPYCVDDTLGVRGNYLAEATAKALTMFDETAGNGFFMMVEGSLIDYASHDNRIDAIIGEVRDFDAAVKVAFDYADRTPGTLVIVTADHETGGLAIVSNDTDFTHKEAGIDYRFSTVSHSASFVPVFAYGAGAHHFAGVMENADIGQKIKSLIAAKP